MRMRVRGSTRMRMAGEGAAESSVVEGVAAR
jgi:hypothetical protein